MAAKEVLKVRSKLYWLDFEHIDIGHLPRMIRQIGCFLLVDQAEALYVKIKAEIMSALRASRTGKLTIHICAGISGGTGSGIFLDVCYLVRKALEEIGKTEANVCGYFFLPDINLSVPTISADPLISESIKINGYAALQELDCCMNFSRNKDSFKMNYGFATVDYTMKPVNLCYLISSTDPSGSMVKNGYQYAMEVVTDHIISLLEEGHISSLEDINSNIMLQHGACIDYNIMGASVAEMPLSEIATYLGAKLQRHL